MREILLFSAMIFLVGCGNNSSSDSNTSLVIPPTPEVIPPTPEVIPPTPDPTTHMTLSTPYTVYPGNTIVKTSDNSQLKITHTDGHEESIVELITGSADIIKQK
jgi:hypothetical protein